MKPWRVLFVVSGIAAVVACAGGPGNPDPDDPGGSSGVRLPTPTSTATSPNPGPSPTTPNPRPTTNPTTVPTTTQPTFGTIDSTSLTSIIAVRSICGAVAGYCGGQTTTTITFGGTTSLQRKSCAQDASDTVTTRVLSADEVTRVRNAVAGLRTTTTRPPLAYDGAMTAATIANNQGQRAYSADPTCNHTAYTIVAEGWDAFYSLVSTL